MIFRRESKGIAEAGVSPPVVGRAPPGARRKWVAVIAGLAACVTLGAVSLSVALTAGAAPKPIGLAVPMLVTGSAAVQAAQLAAMKAVGITSIRVDADWDLGAARRSETVRLDAAGSGGQLGPCRRDVGRFDHRRLPAVGGTGRHERRPVPAPASPAQYATWAAEVAARYAPQGVSMFEIWNEPNNAVFWAAQAQPGCLHRRPGGRLLRDQESRPVGHVISGGLAPEATDGTNISPIDFLKAMYAHGAKGSFDALGYHPYSYPALPNTYEPWSAWSQMAQTNPSIRSVMTSNGDSGKSIWITEFGAPTSGPDGVGQAAQATALTQAIADAKNTSWIGALYIYSWQDDGTDPTQ